MPDAQSLLLDRKRDALRRVEEVYGSLEEFGLHMLEEYPEVFNPEVALEVKAEMTGLHPNEIGLVLNHPRFSQVMTPLLANAAYGPMEQMSHFNEVAKVATRKVKVTPSQMMDAGDYLDRKRGADTGQKNNVFVPIQINFGGSAQEVQVVHGDGDAREVSTYKPARAGDLPPPGTRQRYRQAKDGQQVEQGVQHGSELDFYSGEGYEGQAAPPRGGKVRQDAERAEARRVNPVDIPVGPSEGSSG